jgi:hypothetical protein
MHHCIIKSNIKYKNVIDVIKAGVLQHIVSIDRTGTMKLKLNKNNQNIINIFNELCVDIMKKSLQTYHSFYVYRALYNIPDTMNVLHHPIPFSTTLSLTFAEDWL